MTRAIESAAPPPSPPYRRAFRVAGFSLLALLALALFLTQQPHLLSAEQDPGFCAQCHVTQDHFALWSRSDHRDLPCQACHHLTRTEALRTLFAFLLAPTPDAATEPIPKLHSPVATSETCVACHRRRTGAWPTIAASAGHTLHVDEAKIGCLDCHAKSIHASRTPLDACDGCHPAHEIHVTGMEDVHCLACHNFLTTEESLKPSRRDCLECHRSHGLDDPDFAAEAHMTRLACASCHHPHESVDIGETPCLGCHDRLERQGLHDTSAHGRCTDCHPAHTWTATEDACHRCHATRSPSCDEGPCLACHHATSRRRENR